mgnify:CR=1 FL=1
MSFFYLSFDQVLHTAQQIHHLIQGIPRERLIDFFHLLVAELGEIIISWLVLTGQITRSFLEIVFWQTFFWWLFDNPV